MTIIKPLDGSRPRRIDDEWTTDPQPQPQHPQRTTNKPSRQESSINAKATNRTRDHGTQLDTHALQIMASHLHTGTWQIRRTSTTKQQQTHHTDRLWFSQRLWDSVPSTGTNSHRHRDRPLFSNIGSQQSSNDGLLCQQHHCLHYGDRAEHQQWFRVTTNHISRHWFKQKHQRYQASKLGIHQPTAHKVNVASRDCIELSLDKHVSSESTSEPTMGSMLACNIQSCRGWSSTALFSSTTTSSIAME